MKKILAILILCVLTVTSCSIPIGNGFTFKSDEEVANDIFKQIVDSINERDSLKLQEIFSENVRKNVTDFEKSADDFLEYINADVVSYTKAGPEDEVPVGSEYEIKNGKKKIHITSSFTIETTECKYYVAIKACTRDDLDTDNVGLSSLYVIESSKWYDEKVVYWGYGEWNPGIDIELEVQSDPNPNSEFAVIQY